MVVEVTIVRLEVVVVVNVDAGIGWMRPLTERTITESSRAATVYLLVHVAIDS